MNTMTKGVKKKNKSKKVKLSAKWIVIVILIALIIGVIAYQMIARAVEKHNLLEKYKKLDAVAAKIEDRYPSDSKTSEKYCDRASGFKYEKGKLSCKYTVALSYQVNNIDLANEKKAEISEIIKLPLVNDWYKSTDFVKSEKFANNGYIHQDLYQDGIPDCTVSYQFIEQENILLIDLHCSDFARAEYFPPKGY